MNYKNKANKNKQIVPDDEIICLPSAVNDTERTAAI